MNLTKDQLKKIKDFSNLHLVKNDPWHGLTHAKQTVKLAVALAKKEKADINKCVVVAWLHDIEKNKKDHGKEGAKTAKKFLKKIEINKKDIEDICYAIREHNNGNKKKTKEAQILWDADKLQGIGPHGLLRIYGFYSHKLKNQEKAYKENLKEQDLFINGFQTKTGKKIAKKKFKFMKKFDKHYKDILKGRI